MAIQVQTEIVRSDYVPQATRGQIRKEVMKAWTKYPACLTIAMFIASVSAFGSGVGGMKSGVPSRPKAEPQFDKTRMDSDAACAMIFVKVRQKQEAGIDSLVRECSIASDMCQDARLDLIGTEPFKNNPRVRAMKCPGEKDT